MRGGLISITILNICGQAVQGIRYRFTITTNMAVGEIVLLKDNGVEFPVY